MKSMNKVSRDIFIVMLVILDVYLLNINIITRDYKISKETSSTANYIEIEDITKDNDTKEDIILENNIEVISYEDGEPIVYDNLTLNELSDKINKSLNSTISGKGELIASYSLKMGVDPYMATAIILHETGCKWNCSNLVNSCNNVGGQKGSGCGAYSYFDNLDNGIMAFIDNLSRNYISYGLTTPEQINRKYAEDPNWSKKVNKYIETIKAQ